MALARALVISPPLLLLDEPLSNLDAKLREEMQIELRSIQQNLGTTTIMVTHDQQEALALSDRVVILNGGILSKSVILKIFITILRAIFALIFWEKAISLMSKYIKMETKKPYNLKDLSLMLMPLNIDDDDFEFYVRPEKIRIIDSADQGLSGEVVSKVFLGFYVTYIIATTIGDIKVHTQEKFRDNEVGDKVGIVFKSSDIISFTKELVMKRLPYILLSPALSFYVILLLTPMILTFLLSFHSYSMMTGLVEDYSFKNYIEVVSDSYFIEIFLKTFVLSLIVTVACTVFGSIEAIILFRMSKKIRSIFLLIILGPLLVSVVVRTLGWAILIGKEGIINDTLIAIGIISEP